MKSRRGADIAQRLEFAREIFPLTRLGLFVSLVSGFGLWHFGFAQHDLVWYVGALCALALIVLALVTVVVAAFFVRKVIQTSTDTVSQKCVTDVPWISDFRIPSFSLFPLVNVELDWDKPSAHNVEVSIDENISHEHVILAEHGDFSQIVRNITITDVLGLASMTICHTSSVNLEVMPNRGRLANAPWLASLNDGEDLPHPSGAAVGDRLELRRYHAGDPARFIHWKAFARTRKLMQREPERSLSRTRRTAAYLVAGQDDGASAAAALTVLEASALGIDWVFGADGMPGPLESRKEVEAAIRYSASRREEGGEDLQQFISSVDKGGAFNLMLFVPSSTDKWEGHVNSVLTRSNLECKIVIGIDGLKRQQQNTSWYHWWVQWILNPDVEEMFDIPALDQLITRLETAGAEVIIADRATGRLLNKHHLSTKLSRNTRTKKEVKTFARKAS